MTIRMMKKEKNKIEEPIRLEEFRKCGVHIPCFQAATMEWGQQERKKVCIKYNAVIPFSLDLIYLFNIKPEIFRIKGKQIYTDYICSVDFDKDFCEFTENPSKRLDDKKKKIITYSKTKEKATITHDELRTQFYKDGFRIYQKDINAETKDDQISKNAYIDFIQYKRSSSKSRLGSCLFIEKNLHQKMINWSRMDIDFPEGEEVPLADLKSYESLPLSSLEQLINVNGKYDNSIYQTIFNLEPKNILCVEDVSWEITYPASVTRLDKLRNPYVVNEDNFKSRHDIHDGQGLLDYSLIENTPFKDKCMFLLRERFLKCAAFATDIEIFYRDKCAEDDRDYETATTLDMFKQEHLLKDIKLIITPNSLKLLKPDLAKFVKDDSYIWNKTLTEKENIQCRAFNYWLKNICLFGIVKNEHSSKWNDYQQATYQYLNSLPLSKDDIKEILKPELEYINALKNDTLTFKYHANCHHVSYNKSFIYNLLAVNPEAENTFLFKEWQRSVIKHYINSLKTGAIKIFGDYCTLISSPYEMLCLSYGIDISQPIVKLYESEKGCIEVYTSRFAESEELSIWRNPNINQGNIIWGINRHHNEYKYFHLNDNILVISGATPFCEQAQGADEDSDSCMVNNVPILVQSSKEINQSGHFNIPINKIDVPKTSRSNTPEESADIDNIINASNADIGIVCNWAALLNSLYWDCKSKDYPQNILNDIYDKSSLCSSLSQLAIDRSKKFYTNEQVNISKCLKTIYDIKDKDGKSDLIKTIEIKKRNNDLTNTSDEIIEKVKELCEDYKARNITKDQYNSALDDLLVVVKVNKDGISKEVVMKKPIRSYYFNFLDTGDKRQCVKKEDYWNCPMDYLDVILDGLSKKDNYEDIYIRKDTTKSVRLDKIVSLSHKNEADRKQVDNIFRLAKLYEDEKNQLWNPMKDDYKTTKLNEKELYNKLLEKIGKKKISSKTIEQILYLCYVKKTSVFSITENGVKKYFYYSTYAMLVCGLLWNAHANIFKEVFINAHMQPVEYLIPCETETDNKDRMIWGKGYKVVQYTPEQILEEETAQENIIE